MSHNSSLYIDKNAWKTDKWYIITGNKGLIFFFPWMKLLSTDSNMSIFFNWIQFTIKLTFEMTIKEAQG